MNELRSYLTDNLIWAFNINGIIEIKAICEAVNKASEPAIMLVSQNAIDFAGLDYLVGQFIFARKRLSVPIYLQLDHGTDEKLIEECARRNFDIIMIDSSRKSLEENIACVNRNSKLARRINKKILIEAELGEIAGKQGETSEAMTDPEKVNYFLNETNIDWLAISVGNQHGFSRHKPHLNRQRLKKINTISPLPLVLHGGDWISKQDLLFAVQNGIRKINIGPELRIAVGETVQNLVSSHQFDPTDYRILIDKVTSAVEKTVELKLAFENKSLIT